MAETKVYPRHFEWRFPGGSAKLEIVGLILQIKELKYDGDSDFAPEYSFERMLGEEAKCKVRIYGRRTKDHQEEIPLSPGENEVTISIWNIKNGKVNTVAQKTVVVRGDYDNVQERGIEFILESAGTKKPLPRDHIHEAAGIIATMNSLLNSKFRIKQVLVFDEQGTGASYDGERIMMTSHNLRVGGIKLKATIWHEAAHAFYAQGNESKSRDFENFDSIFGQFYKTSGKIVSTSGFITGEELEKRFEWGEKDRMFALFDESNYLATNRQHGHPYDKPTELFASASTVLKFFPKEFMRRASKLNTDERKLALEAARFVVNQYIQNPRCPKNLFNEELLKYLGIERKFELPIVNRRFLEVLRVK